jgi:hypothetical protein
MNDQLGRNLTLLRSTFINGPLKKAIAWFFLSLQGMTGTLFFFGSSIS